MRQTKSKYRIQDRVLYSHSWLLYQNKAKRTGLSKSTVVCTEFSISLRKVAALISFHSFYVFWFTNLGRAALLQLNVSIFHLISTAKQMGGKINSWVSCLRLTIAFVRLGSSRKQITAVREKPSDHSALYLKDLFLIYLYFLYNLFWRGIIYLTGAPGESKCWLKTQPRIKLLYKTLLFWW